MSAPLTKTQKAEIQYRGELQWLTYLAEKARADALNWHKARIEAASSEAIAAAKERADEGLAHWKRHYHRNAAGEWEPNRP